MKRINKKFVCIGFGFLVCFLLCTVFLGVVDIREIGPRGSSVGVAEINGLFHKLTGVHMALYTVTDWLGLVPIFVAFGFAVLGLVQWIVRRKITLVDHSILVLGGFYILVIAVYIIFEHVVINYRPVLINGYLEVSYPSSTTMLVMCVMPTALMQFNDRIRNVILKRCVALIITVFILFMVIGRLISGVHWITDIVGGALISTSLVFLYRAFAG